MGSGSETLIAVDEGLGVFGFRAGSDSAHSSRTLMIDEVSVLFDAIPREATKDRYREAIVEENLLAKSTRKNRQLSYKYLAALYGLELDCPVFFRFRGFWGLQQASQPMLLFSAALARDPLLRMSLPWYLSLPLGTEVPREMIEDRLSQAFPGRFSAASTKSIAQNLSGSYTVAGFLEGKARKRRTQPLLHPESATFLSFLAYLNGYDNHAILTSPWAKIAGRRMDEFEACLESATHRGWIEFLKAGGVKEIRFPGYLSPSQETYRREVRDAA